MWQNLFHRFAKQKKIVKVTHQGVLRAAQINAMDLDEAKRRVMEILCHGHELVSAQESSTRIDDELRSLLPGALAEILDQYFSITIGEYDTVSRKEIRRDSEDTSIVVIGGDPQIGLWGIKFGRGEVVYGNDFELPGWKPRFTSVLHWFIITLDEYEEIS